MFAGVVMAAGLLLLALASDWFVVGAARIATALRVPAVVVGAVVVGFGTSAPELLVTVLASTSGEAPLAVGNIIGSNLANLTLVLGSAAMFGTVAVDSVTLRREAPISTGAVCLFALAVLIGLSSLWGVGLVAALVVALAVIVRLALRSRACDDVALEDEVAEFEDGAAHSLPWDVARTVIGLAGTLLGAHLVVRSAVEVATGLGLSEGFVGLTIVAVGTSLPELVTAVQAARRGEDDLVIGNVLGSNLFNSLAAGGLVGLVAGDVFLPDRMAWAALLMVVTAVVVGIVMVWRRSFTRPEAIVLLVGYCGTVPLLAI